MKNIFADKARVNKAVKSMVLIAAFAGFSGQALAVQNNASVDQTNPHLIEAVNAVTAVMKKGSPDLKISVSYTDDSTEEAFGHALSDISAKGCKVVLNNNFANNEQMRLLQEYTGWDDEQMAIMLVAHEIQHCVTSDDIRRAVFTKAALNDRTAQALLTYVMGDSIAARVARNPDSKEALRDLVLTAKNASMGRAAESISDITALFLVQKLSAKGLTKESVDGLIKWRAEFATDKVYDRHYTVPALQMYSKMLSINGLLGTEVPPENIAEASYMVVSETAPDTDYSKVSVDDLKSARNTFISETKTTDSFGM